MANHEKTGPRGRAEVRDISSGSQWRGIVLYVAVSIPLMAPDPGKITYERSSPSKGHVLPRGRAPG